MELSRFCADMRNGVITNPTKIIESALLLDAEVTAWAIDIPVSWRYRILTIPSQIRDMCAANGVYGKTYHIYEDLYICNIWNNWRSMRLVINEMIMENTRQIQGLHSEDAGSRDMVEYSGIAARSEQIMQQMQADIVASVPYHFGTTDDLTAASRDVGDTRDITTMAGHILMWPLFLAVDCTDSPPDLRNWAIHCLQKIGHEMGVNQALGMALLLQTGGNTRAWIEQDTTNTVSGISSWDTGRPDNATPERVRNFYDLL